MAETTVFTSPYHQPVLVSALQMRDSSGNMTTIGSMVANLSKTQGIAVNFDNAIMSFSSQGDWYLPTSTQNLICLVNQTTPAPLNVFLPSSPFVSMQCYVKDASGTANVNTITVRDPTGLWIDGGDHFNITGPYDAQVFLFTNGKWNVI